MSSAARPRLTLPGDPPGGTARRAAVWGIGVAVYFVAVIFRTQPRRRRARRRRPLPRQRLGPVDLLHPPAARLRGHADTRRPAGGPARHQEGADPRASCCSPPGSSASPSPPSYGTALASRALLGCGDAMTFISVLRLGTRWFPARRGPLIAQLAGLVGMAGNLVSTLVLARLLHGFGWTAGLRGQRAGRRRRPRPAAALPQGPPRGPRAGAGPRTPGARLRTAADRRRPGGSPAPGSGCGCTSPPSSRRWCSCCCGACRSWSRRRACPGPRPANCSPWSCCRNMVVGPGLRPGHRPAPRGPRCRWRSAPSAATAAGVGGDAGLPRRPRARCGC